MTLVMITFLLLLMAGMPVGFSVGMSGVVFFLQNPDLPIETIVQLPITQTQNVTLLAVPLFILAGSLMNASGITTRLIKLSMQLAGHMRGGMAQVSVVLSTFMGGCSGSSNADAAMEARILGPEMERQGYPRGYSAAVIGYTSLITSTIPPGVGMILYGTVGDVSIGRLFAAGIVAGLMMMTVLMLTVALTSRVRGFAPARDKRAGFKEILDSLGETIWAFLFPVILIGSLRLGFFTPTEVGAFACVYALAIGFFVYRDLNLKRLWQTMQEAVRDMGAIMYLIAMAGIFGYGIPLERIPQHMTEFILGVSTHPAVVMSIVIAFLLLFGMFMEGSVIILLLTPILIPVVTSVGFDPVLFGIVVSVVVTMGILTPPVGVAMYIVCGTLGCRLQDFVRESWPFIGAIIAVVAMYLIFPDVILFLPKLIYG